MAFVQGERFNIDLDSDSDDTPAVPRPPPAPAVGFGFVKDIEERSPAAPKPPSAPTVKSTATGFPAHKKRTRVSAFRKGRADISQGPDDASVQSRHAPKIPPPSSEPVVPRHNVATSKLNEKQDIDRENNLKLASMTQEEIEMERQELFAGLNPSLIERLLKRANLNDGSNEQNFQPRGDASHSLPEASSPETLENPKAEEGNKKKVAFDLPEPAPEPKPSRAVSPKAPEEEPSEDADGPTSSSMHFPRPPQPPELDPSAPDFLENLHDKYFPALSYDPQTLDWMKPVDETQPSSYDPSQASLSPGSLRFSFTGALIPPKTARKIPVTAGLHHHGDAPEAAGYTIPELALLARSAVPSQRCIAFQTLGRLLYRLGIGEFGRSTAKKQSVSTPDGPVKERYVGDSDDEEDEQGSVLADALWDCMEQEKVIEILTEEANKQKGHLSSRTYAQEALWNWRRGGGRQRRAI